MRSNGLPHSLTAPPERRRPAPGKRSRVEANNSALEGRTHDGIDQKVLLSALTALKKGNFSVRLPVEWTGIRSEEHTSELQSRGHLVCRLLLEKKNVRCPSCATDQSRICAI